MREEILVDKKPAKSRLILKKGLKNMLVRTEDLALFYTESKIVFAIDKDNNKYICDQNLSELEELLDDSIFFRANRQSLINIDFIKAFQPFQRVKLQVDVSIAESNYSIIISQVTVGEFKYWLNSIAS